MATVREINSIKDALDQARANYQDIANTAPANEVRAASGVVKELLARLGAAIADGAQPCPCGAGKPHGIEHQRAFGREVGTEYEVGCLACPNKVRGALPRHAVEAWNEKVVGQ